MTDLLSEPHLYRKPSQRVCDPDLVTDLSEVAAERLCRSETNDSSASDRETSRTTPRGAIISVIIDSACNRDESELWSV